jgi:hypothetical protein
MVSSGIKVQVPQVPTSAVRREPSQTRVPIDPSEIIVPLRQPHEPISFCDLSIIEPRVENSHYDQKRQSRSQSSDVTVDKLARQHSRTTHTTKSDRGKFLYGDNGLKEIQYGHSVQLTIFDGLPLTHRLSKDETSIEDNRLLSHWAGRTSLTTHSSNIFQRSPYMRSTL